MTVDTSQDYGAAVSAARELGSKLQLHVGDMVFEFPPGTTIEQAERVWREARRQYLDWFAAQGN